VFVVDQVKERLDAARKIGCEGIDFTKGDPVQQIIKANGGEMVDRAVDAVGYQAVDKSGNKEQPNIILDQIIMVTRPTGGLGIPGLYVPSVSFPSASTCHKRKPLTHQHRTRVLQTRNLAKDNCSSLSASSLKRDSSSVLANATSRPTTVNSAISSFLAVPSLPLSFLTKSTLTRLSMLTTSLTRELMDTPRCCFTPTDLWTSSPSRVALAFLSELWMWHDRSWAITFLDHQMCI
jgi:hypothetical protein